MERIYVIYVALQLIYEEKQKTFHRLYQSITF